MFLKDLLAFFVSKKPLMVSMIKNYSLFFYYCQPSPIVCKHSASSRVSKNAKFSDLPKLSKHLKVIF